MVGDWYELVIDVFDADNNKIYPSDNIVIEVDVPGEFFRVGESSANNTWHLGTPVKAGVADVRATLLGVNDDRGQLVALAMPLRASAQMDIFDKISLEPGLSVFPWDPVDRASYAIRYSISPDDERRASSSSGPFLWSSGNQSVATVTQNGVAKTLSSLGDADIRAAMNRATHNYGTASIRVLPVGGKYEISFSWLLDPQFPLTL